LDNTKITLNISGENFEFIGCTLWFPNLPGNLELSRGWNDFKSIQNFRDYVYKENAISQEFLKQNINENSIVVTHYLPSEKSVHAKYKGDDYNVFFVCDMEDLIKEKNPKLHIFGHTHEKMDYIINKTRLVSNAKGYPNENTAEPFDYFKIVEIKTTEVLKSDETEKLKEDDYKFSIC
jgi:Icc-related predicted phosphoesterase